MENKSLILLESKKGEHVFAFHIPPGASVGEAFDAACEFVNEVTNMAKNAAEKIAAHKKEDQKDDEEKS